MEQRLKNIFLNGLEEYKEPLLRLCSVYATDEDTIQDLFQESVLNIYQSLPSFRGKSNIKTWMYRITLNVCLKLSKTRIRSKVKFVEIAHLENLIDPSSSTEYLDPRLKKLRACIGRLGESERALVSLYLEELPYREISEITGLSENLVAVKLKRIRKKLYHCITNTK
ncbi:MAG: sigma-70 family RNA polymerase sigma factor [Bacteroidota bacterium]